MENKQFSEVNEKHLEFIQSTITRMGQNSFQAKAWCITITSALIAFYVTQVDFSNKTLIIIFASLVVAFFAIIDTYYLHLEKGYRSLYNIAAGLEQGKTVQKFDMKLPSDVRGMKHFFKSLLSLSTGLFYIAIILCLVGIRVFYY